MKKKHADQVMDEAVHAFELALAEVFVVERRHEGKVTHRSVRNKDALDRAKNAYARAMTAVETVRVEQALNRPQVAAFQARLDQAVARLNELVTIAKGAD